MFNPFTHEPTSYPDPQRPGWWLIPANAERRSLRNSLRWLLAVALGAALATAVQRAEAAVPVEPGWYSEVSPTERYECIPDEPDEPAAPAVLECEQALTDACVDRAEPTGGADCTDASLSAGFAACRLALQAIYPGTTAPTTTP